MKESLSEYCHRTQREDLLKEWDTRRNQPLTPEKIGPGSHRKVWWQCAKGHHWQSVVYSRTENMSGCPYCAGRRPIPGENDLAALYPALAAEWHPTKNGTLLPEHCLPGSHRRVWWRCSNGHEWQAQIKSRVHGAGCPICTNRHVITTVNDLASQYSSIAAEWHPTKNGTLLPTQVAPGSHRKVWWQCAKGHEWQAQIASRTIGGNGCPVCSGKAVVAGVNDLASHYPRLAKEWHPTLNGHLTPEMVTPASNRKVWWRCDKGHDYQAKVSSRTMTGSQCPYCTNRKVLAGFNDLATKEPDIAKEWHPTKNGDLTPAMVLPGSHRKVWWQCAAGHEWRAMIYSRTGSQHSGCPVCAGKIKQ